MPHFSSQHLCKTRKNILNPAYFLSFLFTTNDNTHVKVTWMSFRHTTGWQVKWKMSTFKIVISLNCPFKQVHTHRQIWWQIYPTFFNVREQMTRINGFHFELLHNYIKNMYIIKRIDCKYMYLYNNISLKNLYNNHKTQFTIFYPKKIIMYKPQNQWHTNDTPTQI